MNPEFQRNLWLELTPPRLILMAGFVLFVLAAAQAAPEGLPGAHLVAIALYYFLVVLWGGRNAALSVIGEIRERTWDFQRLSAISPIAMVWGKLFGATSFTWVGGILCLPFILLPVWRSQGMGAASAELLLLVLQGVLAQSVSLLTSLNLIRRNHNYWRLDAFLCQVTGLVAAFTFQGAWGLLSVVPQSQPFAWWGMALDPQRFQLLSSLAFTGWALLGAVRAMRVELGFRNGPFVWLAFLAFLGAYEAGFGSWFGGDVLTSHAGLVRLAIADLTVAISAYGMAFLEPKDPVHLRWLIAVARAGHLGKVFMAADCWMLSFATAVLGTLILALWCWYDPAPLFGQSASALIIPLLAAPGFFARDIALFVLLRTWSRERGDFAAIGALAVLYVVLPQMGAPARIFLLPQTSYPAIPLIAAWIQAGGLWAWSLVRIQRRAG